MSKKQAISTCQRAKTTVKMSEIGDFLRSLEITCAHEWETDGDKDEIEKKERKILKNTEKYRKNTKYDFLSPGRNRIKCFTSEKGVFLHKKNTFKHFWCPFYRGRRYRKAPPQKTGIHFCTENDQKILKQQEWQKRFYLKNTFLEEMGRLFYTLYF